MRDREDDRRHDHRPADKHQHAARFGYVGGGWASQQHLPNRIEHDPKDRQYGDDPPDDVHGVIVPTPGWMRNLGAGTWQSAHRRCTTAMPIRKNRWYGEPELEINAIRRSHRRIDAD